MARLAIVLLIIIVVAAEGTVRFRKRHRQRHPQRHTLSIDAKKRQSYDGQQPQYAGEETAEPIPYGPEEEPAPSSYPEDEYKPAPLKHKKKRPHKKPVNYGDDDYAPAKPKKNYPLESCYTNNAGFMCCNSTLEDLIHDIYADLSKGGEWLNCNTQQIANALQEKAEKKFGTEFEVLAGVGDFATKSHFYSDLICKTEREGRYIMAYATPNRHKNPHPKLPKLPDNTVVLNASPRPPPITPAPLPPPPITDAPILQPVPQVQPQTLPPPPPAAPPPPPQYPQTPPPPPPAQYPQNPVPQPAQYPQSAPPPPQYPQSPVPPAQYPQSAQYAQVAVSPAQYPQPVPLAPSSYPSFPQSSQPAYPQPFLG